MQQPRLPSRIVVRWRLSARCTPTTSWPASTARAAATAESDATAHRRQHLHGYKGTRASRATGFARTLTKCRNGGRVAQRDAASATRHARVPAFGHGRWTSGTRRDRQPGRRRRRRRRTRSVRVAEGDRGGAARLGSGGMPIASSTCDSSGTPAWHADPVDTENARQVEQEQQRVAVSAGHGDVHVARDAGRPGRRAAPLTAPMRWSPAHQPGAQLRGRRVRLACDATAADAATANACAPPHPACPSGTAAADPPCTSGTGATPTAHQQGADAHRSADLVGGDAQRGQAPSAGSRSAARRGRPRHPRARAPNLRRRQSAPGGWTVPTSVFAHRVVTRRRRRVDRRIDRATDAHPRRASRRRRPRALPATPTCRASAWCSAPSTQTMRGPRAPAPSTAP